MTRNIRPGVTRLPATDDVHVEEPGQSPDTTRPRLESCGPDPTIDELLDASEAGPSPKEDLSVSEFTETGTFDEIEILLPPEILLSDERFDDES